MYNNSLAERLCGIFIIYAQGIKGDPRKVQAMKDWLMPQNMFEVRNFHGLSNFYRRFICGFSTIVTPITNCLRDKHSFIESLQQRSFEIIKEALCLTLILAIPNFRSRSKLTLTLHPLE